MADRVFRWRPGCRAWYYGLIPSAHGNGYASEALRALLAFARTHGATRVEGDTDLDNLASQHVMTAAGMQLTAEDDHLRYYTIDWADTAAHADPHS